MCHPSDSGKNMKTMSTSNGTSIEIGQSDQELVGSKGKIKRIRIILLVIGILIILALIAVAVVLLVGSNQGENALNGDRLELGDILSGKLIAQRFNGSWISDDEILYRDENRHFVIYDVKDGKHTRVPGSEKPELLESIQYEKSADGKYLLIANDVTRLYRHSFFAHYYVVELATGKILPVEIDGKPELLLLAKWAPVKNGLVVNFNRNLYYIDNQVDRKAVALTNDNENSPILNGHPDWVYEEEVFGSNVAMWFNPAGTMLAFVQFNDGSTEVMNLPFYGIPGVLDYQYPIPKTVIYPKAGSTNPTIKVYSMNLTAAAKGLVEKQEVLVPVGLNTDSHIITAVSWINDNDMLTCWMNRVQNRAFIQISDQSHRYMISSPVSKTGWIDLFTPPLKNKDGSQVALIMPHKQGSDGEYRHLTLLSTENSSRNSPVPLTSGNYVVQQVVNWDASTNLIFYMANAENQSRALHLYAIKAKRGEKPQCLTCGLKSDDQEQTYFSVEFSLNGKYLTVTSLGPGIPQVDIYEWTYKNGNVKLKHLAQWESNDSIRNSLKNRNVPTMEYHTIDIDDGFTAKVSLLIPPGADLSGSTKYPMLVDVYGGPDSYSVVDKWNMDWGSYLSSNYSIIYAKIDGRGSGLRGDRLLHSIYLKLGTVEIHDQIDVARKLQNTLPYIDPARTGIWGWSYGGYASAMALAKDKSNVFKCAASVAPVTDWVYYDSIYTERYMQLPEDNEKGYSDGRLTTLATHFKGKKYLLVHGTFDDNVHYQQSMVFAKSLERNDIMFRQISYADEDHGLAGVRPHLYHSLDNFFADCFDLKSNTPTRN